MAVQICSQRPSFMEPIHKLLNTTINKTKIQPIKFQTESFSFTTTINFPLPYPPPDFPFSVVINHPLFGPIESPVFIPSFEEKVKARVKRKSKGKKKKKNKKQNENEGAPGSSVVQSTNSQVQDNQDHINQAQLELDLNHYLIYFKCVESRVRSTIDKTTFPRPSKENLEDLISLNEDLHVFIKSIEKFIVERELVIAEIEDTKQFQEMLQCTLRLQTVLENLNAAEISNLLQQNIDKKTEHILCSILGLKDEFAEYLINLDPEIRNHQTDEYWILSLIDQQEEDLDDHFDTKSSLISIGFTAERAEHLTSLIRQNPWSDHQTIKYWAKKYIEQQFSYHILLSPQRIAPFAQDGLLQKEYTIDTIKDENNQFTSIPAIDIKLTNKDDIANNEFLTEFLSQEGGSVASTTYWFHGTDHESALNIMRSGIDLDRGKLGGDFSDGRGFYLTSDYNFAHKWPQQLMKKPNTAVIVFKLEKDVFADCTGKEFSEACDEWVHAVRYFRNGKDIKHCGMKKGNSFKRCQYMHGPISKDGSEKKRPNWCPRAREPTIYELCLKDDLLAEDFYNSGNNIYKTLFFH